MAAPMQWMLGRKSHSRLSIKPSLSCVPPPRQTTICFGLRSATILIKDLIHNAATGVMWGNVTVAFAEIVTLRTQPCQILIARRRIRA